MQYIKLYTESTTVSLVGGVSRTIAKPWIASICKFLFWSLAFGLAYTQAPLYTSNQNTKFLIGLAEGGLGYLTEDWLANTVDPLPVFSFLVYVTYKHFPEYLFYFYNILMFGVYLHSLAGIASKVYGIDGERAQYFTFLVAIVALHSYAFDSFSMKSFGFEAGQLVHYGVAEQHMIGRIFQPSVFGVFILLSIYAFLYRKHLLAAFLLTLPSIVHPAYVPISALLTLSYMAVVFLEEKRAKKPFVLGIFNLLLISPVLIYYYVQFSPTSPEIWGKATEILVNVRSPHHMNTEVWLGGLAYAKFTLVIVALYLVKRTKLFPIMFLPLVAAILATVAQTVSENNSLAASTPWRIFVFLVPLSVAMIVARIVSYLFQKYAEQIRSNRQFITAVNSVALVMLVLYGINTQVKRHTKYYSGESIRMMNFVRETKSPGELYLIPVDLEDFRLHTGAPTFATFKSGPFKDAEYLEWYKRVVAARSFYAAEGRACKIVRALDEQYRITHVVLEGAQRDEQCENLYLVYSDDQYRVYKIQEQ